MNAEIKTQLIARLERRGVTFVDNVAGLTRFGQGARKTVDTSTDAYVDHFARGINKTMQAEGFTHAAYLEVDDTDSGDAVGVTVYLGKRD